MILLIIFGLIFLALLVWVIYELKTAPTIEDDYFADEVFSDDIDESQR